MFIRKPFKPSVLSIALILMAGFSQSTEMAHAGGPAGSNKSNSVVTASSKAGMLLPSLRPAPKTPSHILLPALLPVSRLQGAEEFHLSQEFLMTDEQEFLFWLNF